jgi:hypothetical protein
MELATVCRLAVPLMLLTFLAWVRAVDAGTMASAFWVATWYSLTAITWSGYAFVANLLALHTVVQAPFARSPSTTHTMCVHTPLCRA